MPIWGITSQNQAPEVSVFLLVSQNGPPVWVVLNGNLLKVSLVGYIRTPHH